MSAPGSPAPVKPTMNMNDWQYQLKAQKDEERKKQQEAADMLRNHRGGVKEDDSKRAAQRAEERKKQQEAERMLHEYRGKSNGETKARPVRQDPAHPPPVNTTEKQDEPQIAPGSVSAMAANFKGAYMADVQVPMTASESPKSFTDESPPAAQEETLEEETLEEETTGMEPAPEEVVVVVDPVPETGAFIEAPASVEPKSMDTTPVEVLEEPVIMPTEIKQVVETQDAPLVGYPTVVRLDVLFSFGLVTKKKAKPTFAGYLVATEDIVKVTLQANIELAEHVSYDSAYGPFVKEYKMDGTYQDANARTDIARLLVTIAVPIFMGNGIRISHARDGVITGIEGAIQSGRFLTIAQTGNFY